MTIIAVIFSFSLLSETLKKSFIIMFFAKVLNILAQSYERKHGNYV